MSDVGDWFKNIPFITRYWFAGSILVPLIGKLGLISPAHLVLWPEAFFHKFQSQWDLDEINTEIKTES
ncbi:derlin-1 [Tachysurus ichikawai]